MPVIITEFQFKVTDPQAVTDELAKQGTLEKQVVAEVNKANEAFSRQSKILAEETANANKLAEAMKKIPQALSGQAVRQIDNLAKSIKEGTLQIDAFRTATELTKKRLQELDPASDAFKKLQGELKASVIANENLNKSFTSSRGQLRAMRESLLQLEEAGFENTQVFRNLSLEAGKLEDAAGDAQARIKTLASDTFKFDAAIQAIGGVTAAFSIAQGAAGLFESENEELQKTLLKVNSAMAILTGLQQLQNTLQKQTAAVLATENILRRIGAASTALQSAAESRFVIVRVLATKAQAALNAAMAANPAGVLLLAIGALAAALLYFTTRTDEAAEAQAELARQSEFANQSLRNQVDIVGSLAAADQRQLDLLRARGVEGAALRQAEIAATDAQIARNEALLASLRDRSGVEQEFDDVNARLVELRNKREVQLLNDQRLRGEEAKKIAKDAADANAKELQRFLQDQVAANELALLELSETATGFERLVAQIAVIQARLRQTLANTDLGANERLLAEAQALDQIRKARQELIGEEIETFNTREERSKEFIRNEVLNSASGAQQRLQQRQAEAQAELNIVAETEEKKKALRQATFDAVVQLANSLSASVLEATRNQNEAELQILQDRLDRGLISQKQYDQQVTIIKRRQAQQEKQLAIFQATINAAAAIVKVFQTTGPPLSFILAATTAAATLAQIAAISNKPLPAFEKGTKNAPGGASLVAEKGAELIQQADGSWHVATRPSIVDLQPGAKVFTAQETARMMGKNNMYPTAPGHMNLTPKKQDFDYNKLGRVIGKELEKLPISNNNFDENGFSSHTIKMKQLDAYRANRYSSGRT